LERDCASPKEDAVLAALKSNVREPGLHFFPGMDMTKKPTDAEDAAWTAKYIKRATV